MNERIRKLAEQAGMVEVLYSPGFPDIRYPKNFEKFAELIVRECAEVIQQEVSMKYKDGGETEEFMGGHYAGSVLARVKIQQHFGVKE